MIAKIGSGKDTAGLIRYLFDTKKAKDHTDPHLVASWDGFAPDPGRANDFDATKPPRTGPPSGGTSAPSCRSPRTPCVYRPDVSRSAARAGS